jgi:uncharacterized protein
MLKRDLKLPILRDLDEKIVILAGARQCGKTTLSKMLFSKYQYLSYDSSDDRSTLTRGLWDRNQDLVIFDEIHKMKKWKSWLKGIYDKEGVRPRLLVTGSARMTQFKKTGDSLAGRHFNFRLHPFDLNELGPKGLNEQGSAFETLLNVGGFPEPFLKGQKGFYNRWRASHTDIILRQDLLDLEPIRDIKSIEILISLLAERVGTPVSNANLAQHLQKDPKTIAHWLEILEDLFVIFRVTPFHKNIARAIRKEPKYYFYDVGQVRGDRAVRFENLVACSLLKEIHRLHDVDGVRGNLFYLKTKEGKEVDFLVHFEETPAWLIEVKWSDSELSPNFKNFEGLFKNSRRVQLVADLKQERSTAQGHRISRAASWLSKIELI